MNRFERHLPRAARGLALLVFIAVGAALVVSYRSQFGFLRRAKSGWAGGQLSQRLVSVSENIVHRQNQGNQLKYLLKAARDEVYDDGHHELKDVSLTIYGSKGEETALVQAARCVYQQQAGLIIFASDVIATGTDGTVLKTDQLQYDQNTGIITTDTLVTFERANVSGRSVGAEVHTLADREQVILKSEVNVIVQPKGQADESLGQEPLTARCGQATYDKANSVMHLVGNVVMTQAGEQFGADRVELLFDQKNRLKEIEAYGNARLESHADSKTSELRARTMGFFFGRQQRLERAVAAGDAFAVIAEALGRRELRTSRIEVSFTPFDQKGREIFPSEVKGDGGRVELNFSAPMPGVAEGAKARPSLLSASIPSEKRLEAGAVELFYRQGSRDLERVVAKSDVILIITPVQSLERAERKTIRADSLAVEFFERDNLVNTFTADGQVRIEIEPMTPSSGRQSRTTTSQHLVAEVNRETQDIARLTQSGQFRYTSGDQNASGDRAVYDASASTITIRGGEPVVWDSRGRTRAAEIELNAQTEESIARGSVMTTYYNRETTGGAAPFADSRAPVFVSADRLEAKRRVGIASYLGSAKAWQEDSYITADRVELRREERTLISSGNVRSMIYKAKRQDSDAAQAAPVVVTSARMKYLDEQRTVVYEGAVVMKRGTQQLAAETIQVVLNQRAAEIERATAEKGVVVTEPLRRAYGDRAVYTAADDRVVLSGRSARVEDDRSRVTQRGPRLTFTIGGDKVFAEDEAGTQRVRTVRKIH
jgi:LPS export ABC transporter protein LptC/lipopolysaccharide transport protein LptA